MIFMVVSTWPLSSSEELGKVTVDLQSRPLPEYMKRLGQYVVTGADSLKSHSIYEAEKGHDDEAYTEILNRFLEYKTIPGYNFVVENVLPLEAALSLMGLKL